LDGVSIIQLDLNDEAGIRDTVLNNEIDLVLHIASSMSSQMAASFVNALGERKKASSAQTYFVHVGLSMSPLFDRLTSTQCSVTATFSVEGGWPYGEIKDNDPTIIEKDKEIGGPNVVREMNIIVAELAKAQGVTSFNVVLPFVCQYIVFTHALATDHR
jgi:hypothetical protein